MDEESGVGLDKGAGADADGGERAAIAGGSAGGEDPEDDFPLAQLSQPPFHESWTDAQRPSPAPPVPRSWCPLSPTQPFEEEAAQTGARPAQAGDAAHEKAGAIGVGLATASAAQVESGAASLLEAAGFKPEIIEALMARVARDRRDHTIPRGAAADGGGDSAAGVGGGEDLEGELSAEENI